MRHVFYKKYTYLLFVFIYLVFSCNNTNVEKYKIGFANCFDDNDWRKSMVKSMKVESSQYSDIEFDVFESMIDVQLQISQVESMIENDYDVIIVSPLDANLIVPVLEKANDKGISIILIDRKANTNVHTTFISADNYKIGKLAAKYLVAASKGKANVVEVFVNPKTSVGLERSNGFSDGIKEYPNVKLVKRILIADNVNHAEVIANTIDSIQNIDYFFVFNDELAMEAWKIAKEKGNQGKIKFIGVDGLNTQDGGIEMVKQNILKATVLYPTGGQEVIQIAHRILKKENVPKTFNLNTIIIDSLNADIIKNQLDKMNQYQNDIENQQDIVQHLKETYSTQKNILLAVLFILFISILLGGLGVFIIKNIKRQKRELELRNKKITIQRNQIKK